MNASRLGRRKYRAPRDVPAHLEQLFGRDWRTPVFPVSGALSFSTRFETISRAFALTECFQDAYLSCIAVKNRLWMLAAAVYVVLLYRAASADNTHKCTSILTGSVGSSAAMEMSNSSPDLAV